MEWVYVALILGTLIYIGSIVVEYTNCSIRLGPQISSTDRDAEKLGASADAEEALCRETRDRISSAKASVSDLHRQLQALRGERKTEKARKQKLEMVCLKKSLKGRRGVVAA